MTPKNKYPSQSQKPPKMTQMMLSNVRMGTVYTTCATAGPRCSFCGALISAVRSAHHGRVRNGLMCTATGAAPAGLRAGAGHAPRTG